MNRGAAKRAAVTGKKAAAISAAVVGDRHRKRAAAEMAAVAQTVP
jgi:hypothetical protein